VLCGPADEEVAIAALAAGAQDHLLRTDLQVDALVRAVRGAVRDKRAELALANHDPVTGLPQRALLLDRLAHGLRRAGAAPVAVVHLALDGRRPVDDAVACDVARRLEAAVRPGDSVARVGAREFVLVCEDVRDERAADRLAARIVTSLVDAVPGQTSIGFALSGSSATDGVALLDEAAKALHRVLARRGGGWEGVAA
jgi:GGDEF domain-containing protein